MLKRDYSIVCFRFNFYLSKFVSQPGPVTVGWAYSETSDDLNAPVFLSGLATVDFIPEQSSLPECPRNF